jgi:hypothetical protein
MKNIKTMLLLAFSLVLSGCASFSGDPHPGKLERVGVLLVKNCQQGSECDQFSLLEPDMRTRRVSLSGNIDASLKGRLIAVLGQGLAKKDASGQGGMESINVEQSKAITDFDYQPFLSKAVSDYTQKNYQCVSFWDQSYAWRLDGRQPLLIATLGHPSGEDSGTVKLEYDGLNRALLSAERTPVDVNPCQLK